MKIGTNIGVKTGTALFSFLSGALHGLSGLAVASAVLAIGIAVGRHLLSPTDEQTAATLARVRRVLTVVSFLSVSGAIVAWILTATAEEPVPGAHFVRWWFR